MTIKLETEGGATVVIDKNSFAEGGDGGVHTIISPSKYRQSCAKIYLKKDTTGERKEKIRYMVKNKPSSLEGKTYRICWPEEVLFDKGEFVGFIMRLADSKSILLYHLTTPKFNRRLSTDWQNKYPRKNSSKDRSKKGLIARLKICTNVSVVIHIIHKTNKYVIVDLKPQNILASPTGKIYLIDCDSFQISNQTNILHKATHRTPDYSPIESKKINPQNNRMLTSWDNFSLSVIIYEIIFGVHPYTASFSEPYDEVTSIPGKISEGLFVYGNKKHLITNLFPSHKDYEKLPIRIKKLFDRAFELSNDMPDVRPSAKEWAEHLKASALKLEGKNPRVKIQKTQKQTKPKTAPPKKAVQQSPIKKKAPIKKTQPTPKVPPVTPTKKPASKKLNLADWLTSAFWLIVFGAIIYGNIK